MRPSLAAASCRDEAKIWPGRPRSRAGMRWRSVIAAGAVGVAAVASMFSASPTSVANLQLPTPGAVKVPKEAPMFRVVEAPRNPTRTPLDGPPEYGRGTGKHPYWVGKKWTKSPSRALPGEVTKPTKREDRLRKMLRDGELPENEEFDRVIQVFAQRARQDIRYTLPVQRREFCRRAKVWAFEMLLQELSPSRATVQLLMLAFAATGDHVGAKFWLRYLEAKARREEEEGHTYRKEAGAGRLEYNAVIHAFGNVGRPKEALHWFERMDSKGITPDARSYAGLIEAWERLGNRHKMLQFLMEYREKEAAGELGEPLDPRDAGMPYYALARSYMKVADAPRAMSVLKAVKDRGIPLSKEAYRIRLEALCRVTGARSDKGQVERALVDLLKLKTTSAPIVPADVYKHCSRALGSDKIAEIESKLGYSSNEITAEDQNAEMSRYRYANILHAIRSKERGNAGTGALKRKEDDMRYWRKKLKERNPEQVGTTRHGYKRLPTQKGLPEWMSIEKPIKFG
eukprot:gb/GFBE01013211.1/.p1 GENE.gb/GFBE01013211.1/~~gb/GFBE01013211.1/.p1  ORF type:complete len:513 (+),score=85.04 gb/GFBE01013211.1/:1-1539(+)